MSGGVRSERQPFSFSKTTKNNEVKLILEMIPFQLNEDMTTYIA